MAQSVVRKPSFATEGSTKDLDAFLKDEMQEVEADEITCFAMLQAFIYRCIGSSETFDQKSGEKLTKTIIHAGRQEIRRAKNHTIEIATDGLPEVLQVPDNQDGVTTTNKFIEGTALSIKERAQTVKRHLETCRELVNQVADLFGLPEEQKKKVLKWLHDVQIGLSIFNNDVICNIAAVILKVAKELGKATLVVALGCSIGTLTGLSIVAVTSVCATVQATVAGGCLIIVAGALGELIVPIVVAGAVVGAAGALTYYGYRRYQDSKGQ